MAPNSATKGTVCCMIIGTRNADTVSAMLNLKPGRPPTLLENSVTSMMKISAKMPTKNHVVMTT